jgi:hypothetical protein
MGCGQERAGAPGKFCAVIIAARQQGANERKGQETGVSRYFYLLKRLDSPQENRTNRTKMAVLFQSLVERPIGAAFLLSIGHLSNKFLEQIQKLGKHCH